MVLECRESNEYQTRHAAPDARYLKSIEPGCTFIQTNYETRKQNRGAETDALNNAISLLEGTPAFQAATAAAEREALGKCGEDGQPSAPLGKRERRH